MQIRVYDDSTFQNYFYDLGPGGHVHEHKGGISLRLADGATVAGFARDDFSRAFATSTTGETIETYRGNAQPPAEPRK